MDLIDIKDSHSQEPSTLRREIDSLDDFEHLGHDSSPLQETKTGELVGNLMNENLPSARDSDPVLINTGVVEKAATATPANQQILDYDITKFDTTNQEDKTNSLSNKMDTNLFSSGGDNINNLQERNKEIDEKFDKFLQDLSPISTSIKKDDTPEIQDKLEFENFKSVTQSFMDQEREIIEARMMKSSNNDQFIVDDSDSEPDNDDDFKPTKYDDDFIIKKSELPEFKEKSNNDLFKDVEDFDPIPPKKDYPLYEPVVIQPEPVKEKTPEPSIQKVIIEPVKKTVVEPVKKPSPVEPVSTKTTPEIETIKKKEEEIVCKIKPKKVVTEAEAIFCKMGLDTWFNPERLNPKVESLIYWRDPKKSGPVFGGVLLVLLALTYVSLISVVAYLSLIALTATISFRIYKNIVQAVQKTGDGHPFKEFLEFNVTLQQDKVKEVSEVAVAHINAAVTELRRLFLVEDLVDSIKFGVLLWVLTYLGAWFNGMTLIIIGWAALFTIPKIYEANKTQIDANLEIVRTKLAEITSKVKAAIPIGKKAPVEEKKEQ